MQPTTNAFDALDTDWAIECRRHRRSDILVCWTEQEPALAGIDRLADLIPPADSPQDRAAICAAVARIYSAGDELAGRALLQLLVPGLVRITATLGRHLQGTTADASWEITGTAQLYIGRLRHRDHPVRNPAVYVLWSTYRDLIRADQEHNQRRATEESFDDLSDTEQQALAPHRSAEDEACEETLLYSALEEAAQSGHIPRDAINTVWKMLSGYSVAHAARTTGVPLASAFRHRRAAFEQLRHQIAEDQGEAAAQ